MIEKTFIKGAVADTHFLIGSDPWVDQEWVEGPKLNVARSQHASGIITDTETDEKIIVTAGGLDDGDSLDSTELLIGNQWVMGKWTLAPSSGYAA